MYAHERKNGRLDYDRISRNYDKTRRPVGAKLILRAFGHGKTPLADMRVLDAGCGTGNYCEAIASHVGAVVGIDSSKGMIAVARRKILDDGGLRRMSFTVGSITHLPFRDATFDGIMVNQVLHHLHDRPAEGFPEHRTALHELARVLRPGGVIVVGTSSQEQCRRGFWFYRLIPEAAERLRRRFIPLPNLVQMLNSVGFRYRRQRAPRELLLQGDAYFDFRGPLRKAWRDGDSVWALATRDELDRCLSAIQKLDQKGELDERVKRWDVPRQRIGQVTFLFASRDSLLG